MHIEKNKVLIGKHQKPILVDIFYTKTKQPKPIIIFCHGYKGFKDWGCWELVAKQFANKGFCFIKFNFSHNGGTVKQPIDFPDIEAFGNNNFVKELDDLDTVLNFVCMETNIHNEIDIHNISLIAHSRGGGIVLIKASEDIRIKRVITLAGVSDYESRFPNSTILRHWKESGIIHIENSRTKQQLPHYFQFYENFIQHKERLNIQKAVHKLNIPYLIIHGTNDPTVLLKEAENLHSWNSGSELKIIKDANHVFGGKHPWEQAALPQHLYEAIDYSVSFLKKETDNDT